MRWEKERERECVCVCIGLSIEWCISAVFSCGWGGPCWCRQRWCREGRGLLRWRCRSEHTPPRWRPPHAAAREAHSSVSRESDIPSPEPCRQTGRQVDKTRSIRLKADRQDRQVRRTFWTSISGMVRAIPLRSAATLKKAKSTCGAHASQPLEGQGRGKTQGGVGGNRSTRGGRVRVRASSRQAQHKRVTFSLLHSLSHTHIPGLRSLRWPGRGADHCLEQNGHVDHT